VTGHPDGPRGKRRGQEPTDSRPAVQADGGSGQEVETEASVRQIESLHRAATEIGSSTTVEEACERTVHTATDVLDFTLCSVMLYDDGMLVPKAVSEDAPDDAARSMEPTQGLAGRTYQTGESIVVEDVERADDADPARESYRSGLSVPIGGAGVFQAISTELGAFDEEDRRLADLLVSHTAATLERVEREQRLREKNERLEEFAGLVSHDLRNPLHLAYGRTELALETGDIEHVEAVRSALDRMDELIDTLLVLARHGEVAGDPVPIDAGTFAERVWAEMETPDATLVCETDVTVESTETHMRHIFENLLGNALEHARERTEQSVTVTVGSLGDDVGFYVADDGPGIDPERRETVFEPGVTSDRSGTGFGLRVVDQVVEANGWDIAVTESDAGGARFEIQTGRE